MRIELQTYSELYETLRVAEALGRDDIIEQVEDELAARDADAHQYGPVL